MLAIVLQPQSKERAANTISLVSKESKSWLASENRNLSFNFHTLFIKDEKCGEIERRRLVFLRDSTSTSLPSQK